MAAVKLASGLVYVFLCSLLGLGQCLEAELRCNWSVTVDEVYGSDCSNSGVPLQQNQTCSSLEDTLRLASSVQQPCLQVIINRGRHEVEGTHIIESDIFLRGTRGRRCGGRPASKTVRIFSVQPFLQKYR